MRLGCENTQKRISLNNCHGPRTCASPREGADFAGFKVNPTIWHERKGVRVEAEMRPPLNKHLKMGEIPYHASALNKQRVTAKNYKEPNAR